MVSLVSRNANKGTGKKLAGFNRPSVLFVFNNGPKGARTLFVVIITYMYICRKSVSSSVHLHDSTNIARHVRH